MPGTTGPTCLGLTAFERFIGTTAEPVVSARLCDEYLEQKAMPPVHRTETFRRHSCCEEGTRASAWQLLSLSYILFLWVSGCFVIWNNLMFGGVRPLMLCVSLGNTFSPCHSRCLSLSALANSVCPHLVTIVSSALSVTHVWLFLALHGHFPSVVCASFGTCGRTLCLVLCHVSLCCLSRLLSLPCVQCAHR